jgi:hypothetical protein
VRLHLAPPIRPQTYPQELWITGQPQIPDNNPPAAPDRNAPDGADVKPAQPGIGREKTSQKQLDLPEVNGRPVRRLVICRSVESRCAASGARSWSWKWRRTAQRGNVPIAASPQLPWRQTKGDNCQCAGDPNYYCRSASVRTRYMVIVACRSRYRISPRSASSATISPLRIRSRATSTLSQTLHIITPRTLPPRR